MYIRLTSTSDNTDYVMFLAVGVFDVKQGTKIFKIFLFWSPSEFCIIHVKFDHSSVLQWAWALYLHICIGGSTKNSDNPDIGTLWSHMWLCDPFPRGPARNKELPWGPSGWQWLRDGMINCTNPVTGTFQIWWGSDFVLHMKCVFVVYFVTFAPTSISNNCLCCTYWYEYNSTSGSWDSGTMFTTVWNEMTNKGSIVKSSELYLAHVSMFWNDHNIKPVVLVSHSQTEIPTEILSWIMGFVKKKRLVLKPLWHLEVCKVDLWSNNWLNIPSVVIMGAKVVHHQIPDIIYHTELVSSSTIAYSIVSYQFRPRQTCFAHVPSICVSHCRG